MGLLSLLFGGGRLKPELRAALEAEGLVMIEEQLRATLRYTHFRAPGKRFHGKVVPMRVALAISEQRLVIRGGVGTADLVDSPFDSPRWKAVDVSVDGDDRLVIEIDYSRMEEAEAAGVSGEIAIKVRTPKAATIVEEFRARVG